MATIIDVAREADVSPSTVSRVLNETGNISQATVDRVLDAVAKLGYEPNIIARSFRKKETRIILVLTPYANNFYYTNIIPGITDKSRALDYSCFICSVSNMEEKKEMLNKVIKRQADGAILMSTEKGEEWLKDFLEKGIPIVQTSEYDPEIEIPHVCVDDYQATMHAMRYLLSIGHERIGTISSVNNYISTELRLKAYKDALSEAGIAFDDKLIGYASKDYSYQSGCNAARKLLMQLNPPTALFCISDILAIGAINTAREMGINVPRDVSVIGFDDIEQIAMFSPRITTVYQPSYTIGQKAVDMLYHLIQKDEPVPLKTILPYELIIRESTSSR